MPIMRLTRTVRFSAAHRYHRPEWSDERNRQVFGACNNPHGHGHNYVLEVTVEGEVDPETGFCVDLAELDRVLREEVVEKLDHQHLNYAVPEFAEGGMVPTCENILLYLWPRLSRRVSAVTRLLLEEQPGLVVEYSAF